MLVDDGATISNLPEFMVKLLLMSMLAPGWIFIVELTPLNFMKADFTEKNGAMLIAINNLKLLFFNKGLP